jgi:hypothetical protein
MPQHKYRDMALYLCERVQQIVLYIGSIFILYVCGEKVLILSFQGGDYLRYIVQYYRS